MMEWHRIMQKVLDTGEKRQDRTGVGTLSLFGESLRFTNVGENFPAVTTKKLAFKQVCAELACFIRGYDNLEDFHDMGCKIWDANANAPYWKQKARFEGDLGRIYGVNWRGFRGHNSVEVDQLSKLVADLRRDPYSRRHLVTAWQPAELDEMCLPPCHVMFQASMREGGLDLAVVMRSVDLFLGLPFDIASYAVLQCLLAKELGVKARDLTMFLGDAHIYLNHLEAVEQVLARDSRPLPGLWLDPDCTLLTFKPENAGLVSYRPHPPVAAEMNV